MLTEELPIHKDTIRYIELLIKIGDKFPKKFKYTIYDKVLAIAIEMPEILEVANRCVDNLNLRSKYLIQLSTKFNTSKVLIRIMNEMKLITVKDSAALAEIMVAIGSQITGWLNKTIKQ